MIRPFFFLTALLWTSSLHAAQPPMSGYAYGKDHCYGFQAPNGWIQDNRILAKAGVPMAFAPREQDWRHADAMIYTRPVPRESGSSAAQAIRQQVKAVVAQYAADDMDIRPALVRRIRAHYGAAGELWRFTGYRNGGQELVAYFPAKQTVNFFVAQITARADAASVEAALLELANSYHERKDCRPCQEQTSCTTEQPQ